MPKEYEVIVEYDGGIDPDKDKKIEKMMKGKAGGAGCCLFGECTRDLSFYYKSKKKAQTDIASLKAIKGVRANLYEE